MSQSPVEESFTLITMLAKFHSDIQDQLDAMAKTLGVTRERRPYAISARTAMALLLPVGIEWRAQ